jgi:GH15 family glucan-1,4-alpha-glucosidase
MSCRIEDYALIGDCEAAALVGRDGSIDWLCWPRFDSDACFAALLGSEEHGRWQIAPHDKQARVTRQYRHNTLILETRFECSEGAATLVDFLPMHGSHRAWSGRGRRARPHRDGLSSSLRSGYGAVVPVTKLDDGTHRAIAGPDMVVLRTPVHPHRPEPAYRR